MLYSKKLNLSDRIVEFLAFQPGSTLQEMRRTVEVSTGVLSFQAWYKSLKKLASEGIVVKSARRYSLNSAWVNHLDKLVYFAKDNYLVGKNRRGFKLPTPALPKQVIRFPDLLTMDTFWGHVATILVAQNPKEVFYFYNPHTWFFVAHRFEAESYFASLDFLKAKSYTVVGSRSSIDLWSEKFHNMKFAEYYCSPKPIFENNLYLTVIGPYVVEVRIKKQTALRLDKLFSETVFDPNKEEPPAGLEDHFLGKSPSKMILSLDEDKAKILRTRLSKYF